MYELAKKSREDMKSKARRLAGEKDQKVDSSDWSPAAPLNADIKTGARPIMRPSSKGVGESIAASDTKAAIGNPKRGAYKSGGAVKDAGIKDKKALGAIDPSPKRAATPKPYKKGGKVKKAGGGFLENLSNALAGKGYIDGSTWEKSEAVQASDKDSKKSSDSDRMTPAQYAKERAMARKNMRSSKTEKLSPSQYSKEMAMAYQNEQPTIRGSASPVQSEEFMKKGGRVKAKGKKIAKKKGGSVGLTVVIADKRAPGPQTPTLPGGPMMRGVPMPPPAPIGAIGAPGPGPMMPPGAVGAAPPAQLPMGRKSGGRITKVASSYKDMEAGAVSGEGRLQKTDIAKLHKGAPARKDGGRISKVAKSYKDMTAGAGDGEGRLQKTDIAKAKKVRAA